MNSTDNNFTITTVYFDGQFWCALIEKCIDGINYAGRYVFGEEPNNPRLLNWVLHEFSEIHFVQIEKLQKKVRYKKLAENKRTGTIPKSFANYALAQKTYLDSRKKENRRQKRTEKQERWELKQQKKKKK